MKLFMLIIYFLSIFGKIKFWLQMKNKRKAPRADLFPSFPFAMRPRLALQSSFHSRQFNIGGFSDRRGHPVFFFLGACCCCCWCFSFQPSEEKLATINWTEVAAQIERARRGDGNSPKKKEAKHGAVGCGLWAWHFCLRLHTVNTHSSCSVCGVCAPCYVPLWVSECVSLSCAASFPSAAVCLPV